MTIHEESAGVLIVMIDRKDFAKQLGVRIASCRKERGLSQAQLGSRVEQSQQIIADYEAGRRRIPVCNLMNIADVLGVDIAEIIKGSPSPTGKRGPAPKIQRQLEMIQALPKERQRFVLQALDMALSSQA